LNLDDGLGLLELKPKPFNLSLEGGIFLGEGVLLDLLPPPLLG